VFWNLFINLVVVQTTMFLVVVALIHQEEVAILTQHSSVTDLFFGAANRVAICGRDDTQNPLLRFGLYGDGVD
jgi:hypothetical protein